MDYFEKNREFKEMLDELVKIAKLDGIISKSEAQVLSKAEFSVTEFQIKLKNALDNGSITDIEKLKLQNAENNFLQGIFDLIENGEELDEDAKRLVEVLFEIVLSTLD